MNKISAKTLRMITMSAVLLAFLIGAVFHSGTGSLSAFGSGGIAAICPLGYFETALASRDIMPQLLLSLIVIVALTLILGRVFCGWICPVPLVRKLLTNKMEEEKELKHSWSLDGMFGIDKKDSASGLAVLGTTLGSAAIFGFPVFCLICPIGLVFASLFALIRLLNFNEPTADVIVFPIIIIAELVLIKRWCRNFCPVGAFFSILSRFNRTLVPRVDRLLCLEEKNGVKCQRCQSACSLDIELKNGSGSGDISNCTKCRECSDNCPVHAIRFPWR